jgi:hypothetical protein
MRCRSRDVTAPTASQLAKHNEGLQSDQFIH